jgi:hypothetical protein
MTDHGLAGELPGRERTRPSGERGPAEPPTDGREPSESAGRASVPTLAHVLSLCDRHLQEVGRRNHLFGWLRPPGAGADGWLPVDAYYPRNRLVVLYRPRARAHDQIYRELIPEHGLRLLMLSPDELGSTAAGAERALSGMLAQLAPVAPPAGQPVTDEPDLWSRVSSRASAAWHSAATARASATPTPRRRSRPAEGGARDTPERTDGAAPSSRVNGAAASHRAHGAPAHDGGPRGTQPTAAERAERFLATRAAHRTRRARGPGTAESPLIGVAVGLMLFLVLIVAVLYIASSGG